MLSITLSFQIPKGWLLNANQRLHIQQKAIKTSHLRKYSYVEGLSYIKRNNLKTPVFDKFSVTANIYPPTKRKYDPPNLSPTIKALIDGLTDANFWVDDNYDYLTSTTFKHAGKTNNKKNYRIDLILQSTK